MKSKLTATSISLLAAIATTAVAPAETPPEMKMTTDIPEEITTPDKVETAIGNLEFFDGVPSEQTVQTLYENLDSMRGVQTFLAGLPAASMYGPEEAWIDKTWRPGEFEMVK